MLLEIYHKTHTCSLIFTIPICVDQFLLNTCSMNAKTIFTILTGKINYLYISLGNPINKIIFKNVMKCTKCKLHYENGKNVMKFVLKI